MAIYRSSTRQHRERLIQLIYENQEISFYAIVYDLNGKRLHTTDKYMLEELANNKAVRWIHENDI